MRHLAHSRLALSVVTVAVWLAACTSVGLGAINLIARGGYDRVPGLAYGDSPAQQLDLYVPPGASAAPIVVFFHGGRWSTGTKEQYRFVGQALASRGMLVIVASYRRFPEVRFPDFVDDAARAVVWAHANGARHGGDPGALFVMGHSSGAHMAALVALDPRYLEGAGGSASWIRGMIGLAGPYDFNARREDMREVFETTSDADLATTQPVSFAKGSHPPLLLMHGESDETVLKRNTVQLSAAIRREGGTACAVYYRGIDHAGILAALARPLRGTAPVLDDIARFVASLRVPGSILADPACS